MYLAALVIVANTLILKTGDHIAVEGALTQRDGVVIFRSGGALYSVPASEVDESATRAANDVIDATDTAPRRLKVSAAERERLIKALEENHRGTAPLEVHQPAGPPAREPSAEPADPEEWNWRGRARQYEEAIRQAQENVDMLRDRAAALRSHIAGLLSLGWKPQSFTYETTQLAYTEEAIPGAELAVTRAQRAYDQFREDARRQGVMPGWLR